MHPGEEACLVSLRVCVCAALVKNGDVERTPMYSSSCRALLCTMMDIISMQPWISDYCDVEVIYSGGIQTVGGQ